MKTNIFLLSVLVLMGLATEKGNCGVITIFGKEAVRILGIEVATNEVIDVACKVVGTDRLPKDLDKVMDSKLEADTEYTKRLKAKMDRDGEER